MTNIQLATFFKDMNSKLAELYEADGISFEEYQYEFNILKKELILQLKNTYKIKVNRITEMSDKTLPQLKTILRDMYFKYTVKKPQNKNTMESEKLLNAREKNIDFELELAEMMTGDNNIFPYRSSSELTKFFQNLGHDFIHDGSTRKTWVQERLLELNILEIHTLIAKGLFKKKYFIEFSDKLNNQTYGELCQHPDLKSFLVTADECLDKATQTFKKFIKKSIADDEAIDLSFMLDMNVNVELLFDNKAATLDSELNKLIEESKKRFMSNDKQVAIEKIWAAFERLKTFFTDNNEKGNDKKISVQRVINIISTNFDKDFLEEEFKSLTKIGNNYRIRHHEKNKLELTEIHRNYFFFRMLSLVDLCLIFLNNKNISESN